MAIHPASTSNGSGSETIPLELIQTIMDILADDNDTNSLKACSLACRTLGNICRKHIFSSIVIPSFNETHVLQFDQIVKARPSIRSLILHLKYSVGIYDPVGSDSGETEEDGASGIDSNSNSSSSDFEAAGWPPTSMLALHLLHRQRVQIFELEFVEPLLRDSEEKQPWHKIPPFFVSAISSFIRTNPVVHLALSYIQELPVFYLTSARWLRHSISELTLTGVTTLGIPPDNLDITLQSDDEDVDTDVENIDVESDTSFHSSETGSRVPNLEYFTAYWCELGGILGLLEANQNQLRERPLPVMDLTELKELKIAQDESSAMKFIRYALRSSQCLEFLYLEGYDPTLDFLGLLSSNLTPSSLKTLKSMELFPILSAEHEDPYLNLADELERLSQMGMNALEKLSINVRNQTNCLFTTQLARWSRLDEALLSRAGAFPELKEVELKIILAFTNLPVPPALKPQLNVVGTLGFPRLRASRSVKFSFRVEEN